MLVHSTEACRVSPIWRRLKANAFPMGSALHLFNAQVLLHHPRSPQLHFISNPSCSSYVKPSWTQPGSPGTFWISHGDREPWSRNHHSRGPIPYPRVGFNDIKMLCPDSHGPTVQDRWLACAGYSGMIVLLFLFRVLTNWSLNRSSTAYFARLS